MTILFYVIGALVVLAAIGVPLMRNPVFSALCLVANLLGVAALFALLDAHFLAAVQIIVYAGAIVVLVLFVLMLLNVKREGVSRRDLVMYGFATLFAGAFLVVLMPAFRSFERGSSAVVSAGGIEGTVEAIGLELYTRYVFTFEAASILIMVAIAGAVMLARRHIRPHRHEERPL